MAEPPAADRAWWNHHRLASASMLPLFDGVFAVALTLLAFAVPEQLMSAMDASLLYGAIFGYSLAGIAVLLYWTKLRRLVVIARELRLPQLLLGLLCLLTVVVLPKFFALALAFGQGRGDLGNWTISQIANVSFLGTLFLFDGLCLLFALSLVRHQAVRRSDRREVRCAVRAQALGFLALLAMALMELLLPWFNNEYVLLVPLVLLVEEFLVAQRIGRGRLAPVEPPPPGAQPR